MTKKSLFCMALIIALMMLTCWPGYAEEVPGSKESDGQQTLLWRYSDQPIEKDVEMVQLKDILFEKGFYSSIIGNESDIFNSSELDIQTMLAVKKLCELNELEYYNDGVSYDVWWRVSLEPDSLITPQDMGEYRLITYLSKDSGSDTRIQDIQNRLMELGYDGELFTRGVYDDKLQTVIYKFVDWENFEYSESSGGITGEMQQFLFGDAAKPYEAKPVSFAERVNKYMITKASLFGLQIPNIVLWIVGIILICLIVLLILKLVQPVDSSKNQSPQTHQKSRKKASGDIEFTVTYEDQKCVHMCNIKNEKCIRIGRSTGSFPLIAEDSSISRRHCEIYCEGKQLYLHDFSSFGTEINGQLCKHEKHILQSGDVIKLGKHVIIVNY